MPPKFIFLLMVLIIVILIALQKFFAKKSNEISINERELQELLDQYQADDSTPESFAEKIHVLLEKSKITEQAKRVEFFNREVESLHKVKPLREFDKIKDFFIKEN